MKRSELSVGQRVYVKVGWHSFREGYVLATTPHIMEYERGPVAPGAPAYRQGPVLRRFVTPRLRTYQDAMYPVAVLQPTTQEWQLTLQKGRDLFDADQKDARDHEARIRNEEWQAARDKALADNKPRVDAANKLLRARGVAQADEPTYSSRRFKDHNDYVRLTLDEFEKLVVK